MDLFLFAYLCLFFSKNVTNYCKSWSIFVDQNLATGHVIFFVPASDEYFASHKSSVTLYGLLICIYIATITWKVKLTNILICIHSFCFCLFQCNLVHIFNEETWSGRLKSFSGTIWSALLYIFEHSYVSSVGSLTLLMASYSFVPSKLSRRRRAIIGGLHVLAHLTAALLLMLLLELGIEICIRNHLLATSGMSCHIVIPEFLS